MSHQNESRVQRNGLAIAESLFAFIENKALPGSGISSEEFWQGFADIVKLFTPRNEALLTTRDRLQAQIDEYHQQNADVSSQDYKQFLLDIGYLVNQPEETQITTQNVDDEIATLAGPQLVVPINNARYALNAVNARWGNL